MSIPPAGVCMSSSLIFSGTDAEPGGSHHAIPRVSITAGSPGHSCSSDMLLGQRGLAMAQSSFYSSLEVNVVLATEAQHFSGFDVVTHAAWEKHFRVF